MLKLCVCGKLWYVKLLYVKVVCMLLYVKFVSVKLLYVKFVCVCELLLLYVSGRPWYVKLLYVKFVCVCYCMLCESVCVCM